MDFYRLSGAFHRADPACNGKQALASLSFSPREFDGGILRLIFLVDRPLSPS
jgi:hypothetical protein